MNREFVCPKCNSELEIFRDINTLGEEYFKGVCPKCPYARWYHFNE